MTHNPKTNLNNPYKICLGISEPRRAFISQANLISPRRIGNLIREQERKIRKPENRKLFPFLKTYNGMRPKFQPKKPQIMNFGGLMFGQIITHDTGSRYTFQVAGKFQIMNLNLIMRMNIHLHTFNRKKRIGNGLLFERKCQCIASSTFKF